MANEILTPNSKTTALYRATYNGNLEIVKLLVEKYNSDVNLQTGIGETPIIAAAKRDKYAILKYLVEKGADVDFMAKTGLSVIEYSILAGHYETSLFLFDRIKDR